MLTPEQRNELTEHIAQHERDQITRYRSEGLHATTHQG
jgi:ribosomal protein S15P/S13E